MAEISKLCPIQIKKSRKKWKSVSFQKIDSKGVLKMIFVK